MSCSPEQNRKKAEAQAEAKKHMSINVVGSAPRDMTDKPEVHPGNVKESSKSDDDFKDY